MSQSVLEEYLYKTGTQGVAPTIGDYLLMPSGYWVKVLAGGLWAGPYKTTDGTTFSAA